MMKKIMTPNQNLLNWSGYWPGGPKKSNFQLFRCITIMILNVVMVILPEVYFIICNFTDMVEVLQCVSEMLSIALAFFKMGLVLYYTEKLRLLVNEMQDVWEKNRIEESEEEDWCKTYKFTEKQSKILSYAYVITYVGFGTNFMLSPLFVVVITAAINGTPITPDILPTPIKFAYPYDIENSMLNFLLTYFFEAIAIFITILVLSSFDSFYLAMINYSAAFFSYVNFKLTKFWDRNNNGKRWNTATTKELMKELNVLVDHHSKAIEFVDRLEEVSHVFMIIQYMSSTFLFCVVGFQLSILLENTYHFCRILTYLICLNMQLFTFSWFGSKLMEASVDVGHTAYGCAWYKKPVPFQTSMVLIMVRSQYETGISAAKFYYISLESFSKVLSTSLSYFTLLQTIYED